MMHVKHTLSWRKYYLDARYENNFAARSFVTIHHPLYYKRQDKGEEDKEGSHLADGDVVTVSAAQFHLNSVHQPLQLFPHVTRSPHRAKLDKVFKTPLCGITTLYPLQQKEREREKQLNKDDFKIDLNLFCFCNAAFQFYVILSRQWVMISRASNILILT